MQGTNHKHFVIFTAWKTRVLRPHDIEYFTMLVKLKLHS